MVHYQSPKSGSLFQPTLGSSSFFIISCNFLVIFSVKLSPSYSWGLGPKINCHNNSINANKLIDFIQKFFICHLIIFSVHFAYISIPLFFPNLLINWGNLEPDISWSWENIGWTSSWLNIHHVSGWVKIENCSNLSFITDYVVKVFQYKLNYLGSQPIFLIDMI